MNEKPTSTHDMAPSGDDPYRLSAHCTAAKDDAVVMFRAARAAHEHASQAADHAWELAEDARWAWDRARSFGHSETDLSRGGCHRLPEIRWRPTSIMPMPRPGAG